MVVTCGGGKKGDAVQYWYGGAFKGIGTTYLLSWKLGIQVFILLFFLKTYIYIHIHIYINIYVRHILYFKSLKAKLTLTIIFNK